MLVIEGGDCLGKTVLAKKIVRKVSKLGFPVVYSWMTRPNEQLFDFFLDYKKMINHCAVQDRFHLGGLAYHQDKISKDHLQIINSWIRSIGGLIVVLYAEDENRYRERLEHDERGNILSIDLMCRGNNFFKKFNTKGGMDSDYAFNILPNSTFNYKEPNFVNDDDIDELITDWLQRRQDLKI
jgi:hypothetical protein